MRGRSGQPRARRCAGAASGSARSEGRPCGPGALPAGIRSPPDAPCWIGRARQGLDGARPCYQHDPGPVGHRAPPQGGPPPDGFSPWGFRWSEGSPRKEGSGGKPRRGGRRRVGIAALVLTAGGWGWLRPSPPSTCCAGAPAGRGRLVVLHESASHDGRHDVGRRRRRRALGVLAQCGTWGGLTPARPLKR